MMQHHRLVTNSWTLSRIEVFSMVPADELKIYVYSAPRHI